jgi:hypothetical protein
MWNSNAYGLGQIRHRLGGIGFFLPGLMVTIAALFFMASRSTAETIGPVNISTLPGGAVDHSTGAPNQGEGWKISYDSLDREEYGDLYFGLRDDDVPQFAFIGVDLNDNDYSDDTEVLLYNPTESDLAAGKIVFSGNSTLHWFDMDNGALQMASLVDTRVTLTATSGMGPAILSSSIPASTLAPDALLPILGEAFEATILIEADDPRGNGFSPISDLFNDLNTLEGTSSSTSVWPSVWYTPVPEPATMSLLAFGGLAILRRRRRS